MSACNKRPPRGHPMRGSGVACHLPLDHDGPCTWSTERSPARRGIDALLAMFPWREIEAIDSQPRRPIMARDIDEHGNPGEPYAMWYTGSGPWVLVSFVGGAEFAILKHSGAVYQVGLDGAVADDPIIPGIPIP